MCSVADRLVSDLVGDRVVWSWARLPQSATEVRDLQLLQLMLHQVRLNSTKNRWEWGLNMSGDFSIRSVKVWLQVQNREVPDQVFVWNNWTPKKVAMVGWRALVDRLPTKVAISARGIQLQSTCCVFCSDFPETCEHIFASCQFAQTVWSIIIQWCKIPTAFIFSLKDLLEYRNFVQGSAKKKKALYAVSLVYLWSVSLWRMRNDMVFNQGQVSVQKVVEEISIALYCPNGGSASRLKIPVYGHIGPLQQEGMEIHSIKMLYNKY
ncbi:putative reverse transcriptase zinc-binding domain-containing protein [Helianthus debilis subsp. tardiflorus]